jgi:SAM-dependent methyltransferase
MTLPAPSHPSANYRERFYSRYSGLQQGRRQSDQEQHRWGRAYTYYLRGWLPSDRNARIVDIGAGDGRLVALLARLGYLRPIGVDSSPDQVRQAAGRGLPVVHQDAASFLEAEDGLDLIVALDVLEHFTKDEILRFLDVSLASLGAGGRLILQVPNAASPWFGAVQYGDFTHESAFSPRGLAEVLRVCGFEDVIAREVTPVPFGYSAASSVRFVVWRAIRLGMLIDDLVEPAAARQAVYSRVFLMSARKPATIDPLLPPGRETT